MAFAAENKPLFGKGMFTIDPNSTPEQIATKRALMQALMPRFGSAKYVGEGLGQLATGVVMGARGRKLDKIEGDNRAKADAMFSGILGGAMQGPMNILGVNPEYGQDANAPEQIGSDAMAALGKPQNGGYRESLIGTESGGNWSAKNNETGAGGKRGHFGRVQFGHARFEEAKRGAGLPPGMTPEQFIADPAAQMAAEDWHFADLERNLGDLVGAEVNGQKLDMGALVAMGHLGGAGGARKYVQSGGRYNPADSFGTSLSDYAQKHGGNPATNTAIPQIPMDQLMALMSNPWLAPEQRSMLETMMAQQMQAGDPMRQVELQKAQFELDQMQNPPPPAPPEEYTNRIFMAQQAGLEPGSPEFQNYLLTGELPAAAGNDVPASFAAMDLQAKAAGLEPGSPEYQDFMRNGGSSGAPAAFIALDMQAQAAGLTPGSPEYQDFMATRGAGMAAAAKVKGEAAAEAEVAAPADIASADRTLEAIAEVRNHPGRLQGTGASSVLNILPGTSGYDFENRVKQLTSGAFLTAIDEMRGMGALSNTEGQTATAAVTRMDTATSEEEFLAALKDYEDIVKTGRERALKRTKAPVEAAPAAVGNNVLKYNPATGDFE